MTKVSAIKCGKCGDVIFSRAKHDYRVCSCGAVAVDGGFDYFRIAYDGEVPLRLTLEVEPSKAELSSDWSSGADRFGRITEG